MGLPIAEKVVGNRRKKQVVSCATYQLFVRRSVGIRSLVRLAEVVGWLIQVCPIAQGGISVVLAARMLGIERQIKEIHAPYAKCDPGERRWQRQMHPPSLHDVMVRVGMFQESWQSCRSGSTAAANKATENAMAILVRVGGRGRCRGATPCRGADVQGRVKRLCKEIIGNN